MANHRDPDWLLGRRFVADLRVASVGPLVDGESDDDRTVVVHLHGDRAVISLGELRALVESGVIVEAAGERTPRES